MTIRSHPGVRLAWNAESGRSTLGTTTALHLIMQTLIKKVDGHIRAYPLTTVRVDAMWGTGNLVYGTEDGYCGVQLDGETRIDEYPAEHMGDEGKALAEAAGLALALTW